MAGQVNVSLNISDDSFYWALDTSASSPLFQHFSTWDDSYDMAFGRRSCMLYGLILNGFVLAVIIIVGIIGNSLTFIVFWKGHFKSSTSFLFLSLSLADSAVLLSHVPIDIAWLVLHYADWLLNNTHAYIIAYVFPVALMSKMATIWVTVLIGVNRYIIVCLPLRASQWCTLSKVKMQVAVVLVVAVICSIPRFFKYRVIHVTWARDNSTSYIIEQTGLERNAFYMTYHIVMYFMLLSSVPLCILTLLTVRLIQAMKVHHRMQLEMNRVSNKMDSSVTPAFVIVVVVFIIFHTPMFVSRLLDFLPIWDNYGEIMFEVNCFVWEIGSMLVVLSSTVNFAIYILACKSFRDVLIETVCTRRTDMQVVIAHRAEEVNDESDDDHDTPL